MENKVFLKLNKIQTAISVEKTKFNEFGNFNYRSCEDILKALKPLLDANQCVIVLTDELVNFGEKMYVRATAMLIDCENGDTVSADAYAQEPAKPKAKMDESQTTGSTSSYARKYALNGLLALDDNEDSDQTNNGKTTKKPGEKLITKVQIDKLKKLGFTDERLEKMAKYYKVDKVEEITFKQAEETIKKQEKAAENEKAQQQAGEKHE